MSNAIPRDVPFSLSCTECDCDSPGSYGDAVRDGWTHIAYFPEGYSENFLGFCPDCRRREEELTEQLHNAFAGPEEEGADECPT